VQASYDGHSDGSPETFDRFVFEGDLLVHQERTRRQEEFSQLGRTIDFTYDMGGNVVEATNERGHREVFAYDCW
jgi:hypothetical protein